MTSRKNKNERASKRSIETLHIDIEDEQIADQRRDFLYAKSDLSAPKQPKQQTLIGAHLSIVPGSLYNSISSIAASSTPVTLQSEESQNESNYISSPGNPSSTVSLCINDVIYPSKKALFEMKINPKYCKHFEYVHHVQNNKLLMKCKEVVLDSGQSVQRPCQQTIIIPEGTYGNLTRHLMSAHNINLAKNDSGTTHLPIPFSAPVISKPKYDSKNQKQIKFDELILEMYSQGFPFQLVERASFKNIVNLLDPRMNLKSRRFYTQRLEDFAKSSVRPKLNKLLQQIPASGGHFSVDIWSSRRSISVLGIKIHFLSANWEYVVRTIALSEFSESHTAENIQHNFHEIVGNYNIDHAKRGVVISDNASNMKKAFNMQGVLDRYSQAELDFDDTAEQMIETNVSEDELQQESRDPNYSSDEEEDEANVPDSSCNITSGLGWLGCLAHKTQLAINSAMKKDENVSDLVNKVNKIVVLFRRSPKWLAVYRKEVAENCRCETKSGHELVVPNSTRWNSTYRAVDRMTKDEVFQTLKTILPRVNADRMKSSVPCLTNRNRDQLQELGSLLKPLQVLTDALQSDKITCHIVILSVVTAFSGLMKIKCQHFGEFQKELLNNLKERFEKDLSCKWFVLGAVLDPRQKLKLFKGLCSFRIVTWENDKPKLNLPGVRDIEDEFLTELSRNKLPENETAINPKKRSNNQKSSSDLFAFLNEITDEPTQPQSLMQDYHQYVMEPAESESTDPLMFWKQKSLRYPALANLARRILSIPASSGSVERLFSVAGAIGRARRAKLDIKKVEQLIFLGEERK